MSDASGVLLGSHFYAYKKKGMKPWGLPNHLFEEAPHLIVLVDHLHCDKHAYQAEWAVAERFKWVKADLFRKLREREGDPVLVDEDYEAISKEALASVPRRRDVKREDAEVTAAVAQRKNLSIFDWDSGQSGALTRRKLQCLWRLLVSDSPITPREEMLEYSQREALEKARQKELPLLERLRRLQMSTADYRDELHELDLYPLWKEYDEPLRKPAERKLEKYLHWRDICEKYREKARPLINGAFEKEKDYESYRKSLEESLRRKVPELLDGGAGIWLAVGALLYTFVHHDVGAVVFGTGLGLGRNNYQKFRSGRALRYIQKAAAVAGLR
jgi:hypothetical protein